MEKLRTRIVLAHSVGINPDDDVIANYEKMGDEVFGVNYKEWTLITWFTKVPTSEEARESIKTLYLSGIEFEFDEELKTI